MREWLQTILACPFCKGSIKRETADPFRKDLYFLVCSACGALFPVFLGRPLLVPKGREGVKWPPAEAVGWKAGSEVEAVAHLGEQQGLGKDLTKLVTWRSEPWEPYTRSEWLRLVESVRKDARARNDPEWWEANDQRRRLLLSTSTPIPEKPGERSTLDEFACRAIRSNPRRLLDLATGAGGGISRILTNIKGIEYAVATDRDLRCVWQIQYRIDHFRPDVPFEGVGCDIRRLPFRDQSFDYATCYQGLGELCGVSHVLGEAHRVLKPGGTLQLSFHNVQLADYTPPEKVPEMVAWLRANDVIPLSTIEYVAANLPKLGRQEFYAFLDAADLFINLDHLKNDATGCGFVVEDCHIHAQPQASRGSGELAREDFILLLRRV